jgi:ketosteroid isomerase-like protein
MSGSPTNVEIIEAVYAAMKDGDVEAVLARCAPDVTITQTDELPWGGHFVGRDGVLDFATKLVSTITSQVEHEALFEAGDRVVQRGRTRGTVNATGVEFDVAEVHIWTVRDGKAVAAEFHIDTPAMLAALGEGGSA